MLGRLLNIQQSLQICLGCFRRQQYAFNSQWTSKATRSAFLEYFQQQHKHEYCAPSIVIPPKGSGTFFTNAGMNQFKSIFLGTVTAESPLYRLKRVVNSQKCIRLSGKHNDLDEVGYDCTHHTFFEMLGNWSFGDYFKREAIAMAWELMTEVFMIPSDRLYVTYFSGDPSLGLSADTETREIWLETGLSKDRVIPGSTQDNFWEMGNTGPCGPCTEIHYDFIGGRDASHLVNTANPDVVELWNLVFMQYNRLGENEIEPLPSRHVDTGLGLERIVSVLQNKRSNYDTDLFVPIINSISKNAQCDAYSGSIAKESDISYRIVSDHTRMMCISIADGILPGNQGQDGLSVKLRQIMQRSFYHQRKFLRCPPMTASHLVDPVLDTLGGAFSELQQYSNLIKDTISREEDLYYEYISDASCLLNEFITHYPQIKVLKDDDIKRLKDLNRHLEVPSLELLAEVAKDYGLSIDIDFKADTEGPQPVHSTVVSSMLASYLTRNNIPLSDDSSKYVVKVDSSQYEWAGCDGTVLTISSNDKLVDQVNADTPTDVVIITDKTCFYAESGGQAADVGIMFNNNCRLAVKDVQFYGSHVVHTCHIESGSLNTGDRLQMCIDQERRTGCALNHTATHLLGYALRKVINRDIQQAGSSIKAEELTFSFTWQGDTTLTQLSEVSRCINQLIADAIDIENTNILYSTVAKERDVIKLGNYQYPSTVRVVSAGPLRQALSDHNIDFSVELCGGTHAVNTNDLGQFVITGLTGQRQGVKKLTAVTGAQAMVATQLFNHLQSLVTELMADVTNKVNSDTWNARLKEIYRIYGMQAEKLPKIERDILMSKLKQSKITEIIRNREKRLAQQQLQQAIEKVVEQRLEGNPSANISQLLFDNVKDVVKLLGNINSPTPVVIYNKVKSRNQHYDVICYCPSHHKGGTWLNTLTSVHAVDVAQVKTKHDAIVYTIKMPRHLSIENIITGCLEGSAVANENAK